MKIHSISILALTVTSMFACGNYDTISLGKLAVEAVSSEPVVAARARDALRSHGQAGLDALLEAHCEILASDAPRGALTPQRVRDAIDQVARQRDCHASRLYWHTDLDGAQRSARASGKPILSLRLLGNLDEEFSCANSRFFRTTLYANAAVSKFLRENFVLHWQSVRPAPRITIDFGDGRKIERTITGNSVHYVLDSNGRVIDALPGVYGAKAFLAGLSRGAEVSRALAAASERERNVLLGKFHQERLSEVARQWARDLASSGTAVESTELPALLQQLRAVSTDSMWKKIASLHASDATLDAGSQNLIAQKNPNAWQAGRLAISKAVVENPMLRLVRSLERSIAEDTVRNEYLLHTQIHQWLADANHPRQLESLNARVYAELFLTPNTDPWLGLAEPEMFSGLQNNGIVAAAALKRTGALPALDETGGKSDSIR